MAPAEAAKLSMGGVHGSGAHVHFLQGAAEDIPQPDASHDVVIALLQSDLLQSYPLYEH